jgi:hypothetical protein
MYDCLYKKIEGLSPLGKPYKRTDKYWLYQFDRYVKGIDVPKKKSKYAYGE